MCFLDLSSNVPLTISPAKFWYFSNDIPPPESKMIYQSVSILFTIFCNIIEGTANEMKLSKISSNLSNYYLPRKFFKRNVLWLLSRMSQDSGSLKWDRDDVGR